MTDKFPNDERENMIPEDEFGIDGDVPAEDWQEPPMQEDGFHDSERMEAAMDEPHGMREDEMAGDILNDPEMHEGVEEIYEEGAVEEVPRRANGVLFGAIGLALLVMAGGSYFYFSGSSQGDAPAAHVHEAKTQPVLPKTIQDTDVASTDVSPTTGEADLSLLYRGGDSSSIPSGLSSGSAQEEKKAAAPEDSTDIVIRTGLEEDSVVPVPVQDASKKTLPEIAKIEELPLPPTPEVKPDAPTVVPESVGPQPVKEEVPVAIMPTKTVDSGPVQPMAVHDEKVKALEVALAQLKQLNETLRDEVVALKKEAVVGPHVDEGELEKARARLSARDKELEVAQKSLSVVKGENEDLKSEINGLHKKLEAAREKSKQVAVALKKGAKPKTTISKKTAKKTESSVRTADTLAYNVPETTVQTLVPPNSLQTAGSSQKQVVVKTPQSSETASIVLRAAMPDVVWYASSKTDPDLHRASVGDDIPGFGRVLSIRSRDGRWEAVGTKGILR